MPLEPYPPNFDVTKQAHERPGSKKPGQSGEWTCSLWDRQRLFRDDEPRSLVEMFDHSVARHPNRAVILRIPEIVGTSPVQYSSSLEPTTYAQLQVRRNALGSALLALEREGRLKTPSIPGPTPVEITHPGTPHFGSSNRAKAGARRGWAVGTWSKNREEWQVVDLACQAYGLVGVSLYETLGPDVAQYITNHCPLSIIFSAPNHITSLLKLVPKCPSLRVIVSLDTLPPAEKTVLQDWAHHVGIELLELPDLERWGATEGIRTDPGPVKGLSGEIELDQERVASISYTSGTTGDPKGVVLTNANIYQAVISNGLGVTDGFTGEEEWRFLAFMPLSHIYERFLELLVMNGGGTIGYTTGDVTRLLDDAQLIQPEFMAGVPRVWNRINAAIKTQLAAGGLKGALLKKAVDAKLHNWRTTGQVTHRVYDALVFRKIRNMLGGKVKYISSGAAPLTPEVHEILKIAFSCEVVQGYGMTESIGTCSKGVPWDIDAVGTCGGLQPCNDAKVVDVPDMGYTSEDKPFPRGELCLKGANIVPGYLHDPENTAKLLDKDGWLHTGDIGLIDNCGRIKIVDRVKNVIKLSQGEYVALEKLEGMYALNPLFATLLVHGDSTRASIVAVAVLDPVNTASLIKHTLGKNVSPTDMQALEAAIADPKVKKEVLKGFAKVARQNKLNGFEMIKGVHLTMQPFAENLLTPTLKVKRQVAAKHFRKEIDAIYEESENASAAASQGKAKL